MEKLLLPFIFLFPLLFIAGLYRFMRLATRKISFRSKVIGIIYGLSLVFAMSGFFYFGWYFYRCVWPNQCGEGFASGYIAAGVLVGIGITSLVYGITEVILYFALRKGNFDSKDLPDSEDQRGT